MQQYLAVDLTLISTKMSKICKAAAVKTKSLGNYRQTFKAHDAEQKVSQFFL